MKPIKQTRVVVSYTNWCRANVPVPIPAPGKNPYLVWAEQFWWALFTVGVYSRRAFYLIPNSVIADFVIIDDYFENHKQTK